MLASIEQVNALLIFNNYIKGHFKVFEIFIKSTSPFQIVIPSKAVKNEKIMETLMVQANSGMYRVHDTYFEACKQKLQKQDSKVSSSEWGSLEAAL